MSTYAVSDEQFRARLENHFAQYRLNLRLPIVKNVCFDCWYRVELLLVNELGLFRRADILPDTSVEIACELRSLEQQQQQLYPIEVRGLTTWDNTLKHAPSQQGPGFHGVGKGGFEYRICVPPSPAVSTAELYLFIYVKEDGIFRNTLPLLVGPIHPVNERPNLVSLPTYAPIEAWPENTEMVHQTFRVFGNQESVLIQESWDAGIPGKIWDSALAMLQFLEHMYEHNPDIFSNAHIIDLSAGTGLLGLYVAKLATAAKKDNQGFKVTITELGEALDLIHHNVDLNSSISAPDVVKVHELLWGNQEQASMCGKADMILASDVLYEAEFFQDLSKTLKSLSTSKTEIFIGYKRRGLDEADELRFWSLCQGQGFCVELITEGLPSLALATNVQIYRLTLANN